MPTFKTVLFDWEGVIGPQDTQSFGWLMRRLTHKYGVEQAQTIVALSSAVGDFMTGHITNELFWQKVGKSLGVSFTPEFQQTIWQDWPGAQAIPEMEALVREVKRRGLRAVVFSNILPASAAKIREIAGYDGFDAEVLSCEVGFKKPDPAIYQKALDAAQCLPKECIFIDDKEPNLVPARALGMTTILAINPKQIEQDLLQLL